MANLPLSVFIIAKNEADRIPKAITSAKKLTSEILVIVDNEKDDTIKIAKSLKAKVLINKWDGYGKQKSFGEKNCTHNWILNLDADEELSAKLIEEIITLFKTGKIEEFSAFILKVKISMNGEKPRWLADYTKTVRLYNKQKGGFSISPVHDSVIVKEGKIGYLKNIVNHHCFRNLAHWVEKINFYSSLQAKDYVAKKRKIPRLRILFEPFFSFFKAYIIRRYFIYGFDGIIYAGLYVHARMLRLGKIREEYFFQTNAQKNSNK